MCGKIMSTFGKKKCHLNKFQCSLPMKPDHLAGYFFSVCHYINNNYLFIYLLFGVHGNFRKLALSPLFLSSSYFTPIFVLSVSFSILSYSSSGSSSNSSSSSHKLSIFSRLNPTSFFLIRFKSHFDRPFFHFWGYPK